jgi:hypothetical protein
VYNGYSVEAQQKCLAHLRRHFKKVVKLGHGNNPTLGKAQREDANGEIENFSQKERLPRILYFVILSSIPTSFFSFSRTYALTNQPKYEASAKITEFLWQVKFGPSQTIAKSP